jgi:hypothetical protein
LVLSDRIQERFYKSTIPDQYNSTWIKYHGKFSCHEISWNTANLTLNNNQSINLQRVFSEMIEKKTHVTIQIISVIFKKSYHFYLSAETATFFLSPLMAHCYNFKWKKYFHAYSLLWHKIINYMIQWQTYFFQQLFDFEY